MVGFGPDGRGRVRPGNEGKTREWKRGGRRTLPRCLALYGTEERGSHLRISSRSLPRTLSLSLRTSCGGQMAGWRAAASLAVLDGLTPVPLSSCSPLSHLNPPPFPQEIPPRNTATPTLTPLTHTCATLSRCQRGTSSFTAGPLDRDPPATWPPERPRRVIPWAASSCTRPSCRSTAWSSSRDAPCQGISFQTSTSSPTSDRLSCSSTGPRTRSSPSTTRSSSLEPLNRSTGLSPSLSRGWGTTTSTLWSGRSSSNGYRTL